MPPIYLTSDLLSYKRKPNLFNPGRKKIGADPYFDNVVLYLRGDDTNGSTTIIDESLTPKTITVNGDTQISTAQSKYGGSSIYFDGTGDYLEINQDIADFDLPSDFTVETWVYLAAYSPSYSSSYGACLAATYDVGVTYGWQLRINGTSSSFTTVNVYTGATDLNFSHSFSLDTWYHVALSRSSNILKAFVDGNEIGSVSNSNAFSGNNKLRVGRLQNSTYLFDLNGYVDSFRITKGIARYTANFNPETDTYLAY